jgi:hypothetical protein
VPVPVPLFFSGAEHAAHAAALAGGSYAVSGGAWSIVSTAAYLHKSNGFGGSYAWYEATGIAASYIQFQNFGLTGRYTHAYVVNVTNGASSANKYIQWLDGVTSHLSLLWAANGSLDLRRGTTAGTSIATAAIGTVPRGAGATVYWRFECVIDDVAGVFKAYANGNLVINFAGDTRNAGNARFDNVRIGQVGNGGEFAVDDVSIFDATADPTGEYFEVSPNPSSDVAVTLTPSTGAANYACVDERPPNAADYVSKTPAVAGDGDTYGQASWAGLGFTPASVIAVKVGAVFQRDGVITGAKMRLRTGGVTYTSATQAGAAAGTEAFKSAMWTTNPDGSGDWDVADAGAVDHGVEAA